MSINYQLNLNAEPYIPIRPKRQNKRKSKYVEHILNLNAKPYIPKNIEYLYKISLISKFKF